MHRDLALADKCLEMIRVTQTALQWSHWWSLAFRIASFRQHPHLAMLRRSPCDLSVRGCDRRDVAVAVVGLEVLAKKGSRVDSYRDSHRDPPQVVVGTSS